MALYRVQAGNGVVWITGASNGIGRELALQMARDGYTVAVSARSADKLESLAEESNNLKGAIHAYPCDVTDRGKMDETVQRIESEIGSITLAVFNAGNYFPTHGEAMRVDTFVDTYKINIFGVLHGLVPVVERMKAAGKGQIVLMASVSAYTGLPGASAYGATKAALNSMAESLLFDFEKMNIRIQVVNPGFVKTPLTDKNDFPMPAKMPLDRAIARLIAGIERGGFEITFPRRFTWFMKFLRILPYPVYFWLVKNGTGWKNRPLNFRGSTPAAHTQPVRIE